MLEVAINHTAGEFNLALEVTFPATGVSAILGRSGAGKSTLMHCIAGLSQPQQGRIVLNNRVLFDHRQGIHLAPEKRRIGFVFQESRLFPHYSVYDNLTYGFKVQSQRKDEAKLAQIVELLGIKALLSRFPAHLSGGEKQRVAIGRALLSAPDLLLMDEPLSGLDVPRQQELLGYLEQLSQHIQLPILYVTHHLDEVRRLADQVLMLENGKKIDFVPQSDLAHHPHWQKWQSSAQSQPTIAQQAVQNTFAWEARWEHSPRLTSLTLTWLATDSTPYWSVFALREQRLSFHTPTVSIAHMQINASSASPLQFRFTFASDAVILSLAMPDSSTMRNILSGTVRLIEAVADNMSAEAEATAIVAYHIGVVVEETLIWATITSEALERLSIQIGQQVWVSLLSYHHITAL